MRLARVLQLQPQSLAPCPNLHFNAAVTTAARVHSYSHVCHARYASRRTPTTTPTTMQRMAADQRGACESRREACLPMNQRNIGATKSSELLAAMGIAADSQIARRIYGLLADGTHFSTQTTKMVPWLSYA